MAVARFGGGDKIPRQRRFLTSGTWVVPAGVKWVKARIVGAGAAGRAALANGSGFQGLPQVAGSPGGQVIDTVISVTPGSSMTVSVAPTTAATLYTNTSGVSQETSLVAGASSSFGGVTALGGTADLDNLGLVSAGPGGGYGAGFAQLVGANAATLVGNFEVGGTSGPGDYGAGSGAFYIFGGLNNLIYVPPGPGGVRARTITSGVQGQGIDAPPNSGSAGGPISGITNANTFSNFRAGNGGSGIVILDWEEYA